jgi:hypothetical protein
VNFHALRHIHVSIPISKRMDIHSRLAGALAPSKPSVTLDVYGHLMGGSNEAAAQAIGDVLK